MAKIMKRDEVPEAEMDMHDGSSVVKTPLENSDIDELDSIADESFMAIDGSAMDSSIEMEDIELEPESEPESEQRLEDDMSPDESRSLIQEAKEAQSKKEMEIQKAQNQQERDSGRVALEMIGSAMNGVSNLLRGSAKLTSDMAGSLLEGRVLSKLREINQQEAFRGIKSLEDMTPYFESNLFKDITQEFGNDSASITKSQSAIISDLMSGYQSKNGSFKELMGDAARTMRYSEKRLDYFTKNLDSSDESKAKMEAYIQRLEKIQQQVPGWLKVGDTNVADFLSKLVEKAQKFFDSKFGSSPGMSN